MANFFANQLDFIFFFYGLAFILLGVTCLSIARMRSRDEAWAVLGAFGFLHGAGEWLDLTALVVGDAPSFALARTGLMAASFILLIEFARREGIRFGLSLPGRWVYLPLLAFVVVAGDFWGLAAANAVARYAIGFVGAFASSMVFVKYAKQYEGPARLLAFSAAAAFALYGVAAGIIAPAAPIWPANSLNYAWYVGVSGTPIQLLRGILACWIAYSLWAIWGQLLVLEVGSERYTAYLQKQFAWTVVAMGAILICGWLLTEFLGGIYQQNVEAEARGNIDLLASRLAGETATVEAMVMALAGSPSVPLLAADGGEQVRKLVKSTLDLDVEASGAELGFILNDAGAVVASSGRQEAPPLPMAPSSQNFSAVDFFRKSIAGTAGYSFVFDTANRRQDYFASYPIRTAGGRIVGVAVLKKSLNAFEADLRQFDHPYFFIDPNGIVVLTNRPKMLLRTLWPLPAEKRMALTTEFGVLNDRPIAQREIIDATWTSFDGQFGYVRRRYADDSDWSLVIITPTSEIFANRLLGIIITLLATIMTLVYLFGKERWVHDAVQTAKRIELQKLASELRFQAATDPLTGLFNRLAFDEALANEMLRAQRYNTPLSFMVYDVDHFKWINDNYGHQTGDSVLIELSRFVYGRIRGSDLLARWGGEEFVILVPGSDGHMAYQAAEKLRDEIDRIVFEAVGNVTCSFGVAQYAAGEAAETLIARADLALYRAKIAGRNRVELAQHTAAMEADFASVA